jgi:hypothetical protein
MLLLSSDSGGLMIKGIFAIAALFMLLAPSFAAVEDLCAVNFYLDVPIHVIDANHMDARGVNVTITYQKRSNRFTPGPEYVTTDPQITNETGEAHFLILNTVPNSQYLDCKLKINTSLMNYSKVTTVDLKHFFKEYTVNISAGKFWITLKDSTGQPISARLMLYPDISYDINGSMELLLPYKPTPSILIYKNHRQSVVLNANNGTPYYLDVVFRTYDLNVTVYDDLGNPLQFSVQSGNDTPVSGTGMATIRLVDSPTTIKVSAAGKDVYKEVSPALIGTEAFYVDLHAPTISNVRISPGSEGRLDVSYSVSDPGKKASGLLDTGIYINDVYYPASVTGGFARVSVTPKGDFDFNITATDNDGNTAVVSGKYSSGSIPLNGTNVTGNQSGGGSNVSAGNDNTLVFVALGIIVVIILAYMFTHGSGGESSDVSI